jgi:hypothetical protein
MIDVPWEKHRCFFEDRASPDDALERVRKTARELGSHPAVFAISIANEIPHDIVRFYGSRRIERFIDQLLHCSKQEAPQCLVTYSNYPSTEFLSPSLVDFYCVNIYLHDSSALAKYLDRLQHVAGEKPLIIGEHGVDSIREGADAQALMLQEQIDCLFAKGAAGSFVFSYTDEWFAGGQQIRDWAFGVTTADRLEKPAAPALRRIWATLPHLSPNPAPKVSVVVCSYNGADTLEECLSSLTELDYPSYEVILVDDGSTDDTPQIAARLPKVKYIRQENLGLSAARNAGAHAATGDIVAYTDADCVADPTWLTYLVHGMLTQNADAIVTAFIATLSFFFLPLLPISGIMSCASLAAAARSAIAAPPGSRLLVLLLHLLQPIVRGGHRLLYLIRARTIPKLSSTEKLTNLKRISFNQFDLYWQSRHGIGRSELLHTLAEKAPTEGWRGDFRCPWQPHDIQLIAGLWHDLCIRTATEELGGTHRFTRARCSFHLTWFSRIAIAASLIGIAAASITHNRWAISITAGALAVVTMAIFFSRRRAKHAVAALLTRAATACGLDPFALAESQPTPQFAQDTDSQSLGLRKNVRDDLAVHVR